MTHYYGATEFVELDFVLYRLGSDILLNDRLICSKWESTQTIIIILGILTINYYHKPIESAIVRVQA